MISTMSLAPDTSLTSRQKKLLFRAWHRGTREMDLLFGRFAEQALPYWDEAGLDLFEDLLDENDPDVYDWVSGRMPLPALPVSSLLQDMIRFYQVQS